MLNVMIAEDDLIMADMLEDVLVQNGYKVCGIAPTVAEGIELGERYKPDLAVLDVRLANGDLGFDIAARLDHPAGPGILYATGNMGQIDLAWACGEACLVKPYRPADILHALNIVQEIVSTGKSSTPFPRGFYLLEQPARTTASVRSLTRSEEKLRAANWPRSSGFEGSKLLLRDLVASLLANPISIRF